VDTGLYLHEHPGVALSVTDLGAGVWTAVGITAVLDAPRFGRERRDRYAADLRELAALPARPEHFT
jgi:hypothetical protein